LLLNTIYVYLPDGTINQVTHVGQVQLSSTFILHEVFYLPQFKYNLPSASKLLHNTHLVLIFLDCYCLIQDLKTEQMIAVGREIDGLYIISQTSFLASTIQPVVESLQSCVFVNAMRSATKLNKESLISNKSFSVVHTDLLHARLGHVSLDKLKHIP